MDKHFIRVSSTDSRYLEYDDGRPFVPNGANLCFPRRLREEEAVFGYYEELFSSLGRNGGNFARIWLSSPFFEVEPERQGKFDPARRRRIAKVAELASKHGIKLKLTLNHSRSLSDQPQPEKFPGAANFVNHVYARNGGGSFDSIDEFLSSPEGDAVFLAKLDFLAEAFRSEPAIMAWELWNEVNCTGPFELWSRWSERMLPELKRRFPNHLALQSLGSYDSIGGNRIYRWLGALEGNEIVQAHRYLDPGADLDVCRGALDLAGRDVIAQLRAFAPDSPLLWAEGGAVEWKHSAPSRLYALDREGMLLHDILFSSWFAGAAGSGQPWHWEEYLMPGDHWRHFRFFAEAVRGIDPRCERFRTRLLENRELRLHLLDGETQLSVWCRDKANDWRSELEESSPPRLRKGIELDLRDLSADPVASVEFYAPWSGERGSLPVRDCRIELSEFERSLVLTCHKVR